MMNDTDTPRTRMSRNEWLVDAGGWLVIFGLLVEVGLAITFHGGEPWYEQWSLVVANILIAGGVYLEIHFGGNVRAEANAREAEANERAETARAEAAKANERILEMQKLRRLDKEKAAALVPLLKSDLFQNDPKPSLRIGSVVDPEAQMYAMDFQRLFESCGVNIYPTNGGLPNDCVQFEPNADGLIMTVKSRNNLHPQAFPRFQQLMSDLGLKFDVEEDPQRRDNEAMLTVLKKPS